MKKINFPLCIGIMLLIILFVISFFPKSFTDIDPTTTSQFKLVKEANENGYKTTVESHPAKPDKENILGTDELGRDIYARLIYGTQTTLKAAILVVLFRLLLAVPIGLAAGIGIKMFSYTIKLFNTIFTAIPILLISIFILNLRYVTNLSTDKSIIAFGVVLSILGWSKLARQIEEKASKIMNEEFIEGEVAVGKSKIQIAVQNMLPHLVSSLISFVFLEIGLVIFLLAQLSIFGVFIGPRVPVMALEGNVARWYSASDPEWAALLSQMLLYNRVGKYWVGLYPALAFAVGILAFNLTGEGLRIEFEKRNSKVVSNIRSFGFVFSPKIYFLQIRRYKEYYKPVIIKTLCIFILLIYIFMPAAKSLYIFETDYAIENIKELMKPEYEGRLVGYEGNYLAGEYIIETLKAYGLEPYDGENYIQTFPISKDRGGSAGAVVIEEAKINLKHEDGEISTFMLHKDFEVAAFSTLDMMGAILDEEGFITLEGNTFDDIEQYAERVKAGEAARGLMYVGFFDSYAYVQRGIFDLSYRSYAPTHVSFFIVDNYSQQVVTTSLRTSHVIIPKGELAEKLKAGMHTVEIKIKLPKAPTSEGRNIFAVLPGKDWHQPNDSQNKKEVIIVGASYDGIGMSNGDTSAIRASRAAISLEIARVLSQMDEKLDKTIVFAFWDGESISRNGADYYNVYDRVFHQTDYLVYYLDVGYAGKNDRINVYIESPSLFKIDTFDMTKSIHERLKKQNIKFSSSPSYASTFSSIGLNLYLKLSINTADFYYMDTNKDTIENIDRRQLNNIGQLLIDLITMNEHFK